MSVYEFPVDIMVEPDSSFVEEVGYIKPDDEGYHGGYLYIRLNGQYYVYKDVDQSEFSELAHARSVGHAYREFASGRKSIGNYPSAEYQMVWDGKPIDGQTELDTEADLEVIVDEIQDFVGGQEVAEIQWEDEPEEVSVEQYLWIRTEALKRAVDCSGFNPDGDATLALARKFEDYIFNG